MEKGIFNRNGEYFTHSHIRNTIMKPIYIGVLFCGEARSQPIPELRIIDDDLWEQAQKIRESRADKLRTKEAKNKSKYLQYPTLPKEAHYFQVIYFVQPVVANSLYQAPGVRISVKKMVR
jgi:hypothetical protein